MAPIYPPSVPDTSSSCPLRLQLGDSLPRSRDSFSQLALGDLEAAHRRSGAFDVLQRFHPVLGLKPGQLYPGFLELRVDRRAGWVRDFASRIVGDHPVIDEGIERVLLAEILKEIFLAPPLEH